MHLWSIANFWLLGRKIMVGLDPSLDDPVAACTVLDFWERAARAFRADGTRQAWDTSTCRPYGPDVVERLMAGVVPVDDPDERRRLSRFNATLVNHLFLMWFDTRAGIADSGPYALADGRVLLVRDFAKLARSDFRWSDVAADRAVPAADRGAGARRRPTCRRPTSARRTPSPRTTSTGWSASGCSPPTSRAASCTQVPLDEVDDLAAAIRTVQAQHYRNVAAMDRDDMIRCGAYVYFSFLRPFALAAGIADELDWEVPRDIPEPLYDLLAQVNGEDVPFDPDAEYYEPIA